MEKYDSSIIIVNWNTKELLRNCLKSLYNFTTGLSFEVIVVDNASSDGSPEMIRDEFPQVILIQNEINLGFGRANNIGCQKSSGKYICLVNSDIVFIENAIKSLFDYMESRCDIGISGPKLLWPDRTLQLSCREFPSLKNQIMPALGFHRLFPKSNLCSTEHMGYFDHATVCQVDVLVGAFLMIRRSVIEQLGLFDEAYFMYCEEVDLCRRFNRAGQKIVFYPSAQVIHICGGSSKAAPIAMSKEHYLSCLRYWQKHHSHWQQTAYRWIHVMRLVFRNLFLGVTFFWLQGKEHPGKTKWKSNVEVLKILVRGKPGKGC